MDILKVGDIVNWKGSWGKDETEQVKVKSIEVDCVGKEGTPVNEVPWDEVEGSDKVIVVLENSHWAYGYQISPIDDDENINQNEELKIVKIFDFGGIGLIMN